MHVHVKEISHLLGERDKGQWDWWEVSEWMRDVEDRAEEEDWRIFFSC